MGEGADLILALGRGRYDPLGRRHRQGPSTAARGRQHGGRGRDDLYFIDNAADQVELAGEGNDTATASVNTTLSAEVETLILTGAARQGTGNALANQIIGTAFDDTLDQGRGHRHADRGAGNDTWRPSRTW